MDDFFVGLYEVFHGFVELLDLAASLWIHSQQHSLELLLYRLAKAFAQKNHRKIKTIFRWPYNQ